MSAEPQIPSMAKQTEPNFNLVIQANKEFDRADYEKCLGILDQLELSGNGNGISSNKLQHNRAVVKFYKTDCKEHAALLKVLNELDLDEAGAPSTLLLSNCANPIAKYNKAVVYFHRHMYETAIATLAPLVQKLDSLDEETASRVGMLMLQLLIFTNQPRKAQAFLEFVQVKLNICADTHTPDEKSSAKGSTKVVGYGRSFHLLALLTNILNDKPVAIPEDGSSEYAALKAHQYYLMKDFQMAAKQLMKINASIVSEGTSTDVLNTCIANNMGVIHLRVRHYALAAKFFQKAISFDRKIAANVRNAPLYEVSGARSCEILYNLGISMLYLRRPKEAFQCLLVPLKSYHNNPRLWLRMAEACIMDHEMKLAEDAKKSCRSTTHNFAKDGADALKYHPVKAYSTISQSVAVPEPNLEFAALSLRNALTLTLVYSRSFHTHDAEGASGSTESEGKNWHNVKDNSFCNPSTPICKESLDNMLSAIYAAYSYVSLRLGDYVMALEMAQELLKLKTLSDAHRLLAHMYAGEALVMMDKTADALPHLEPTFVSSLNAFDFETKDWQVKSLDAAQSVVRYNLAVALVLQGDFEGGKTLLATCTHPIVASKTASLKMYLNSKGV